MKNGLYICILSLFSLTIAQAQERAEETSRIEFLSGQDTIRINPEFRELIESGKFLIVDPHTQDLYRMSPELPILQDFSEYIFSDSTRSLIEHTKLPTYVFLRYGLDSIPEEVTLKSFRLTKADIAELKGLYNSTGPQGYSIRFGMQYSIPGPGIGGRFSMEDILRRVFWKSERAKIRNRKHANAYKTYNLLP